MRIHLTTGTDSESVENKVLIYIAEKFAEAANKNISGGIGLKLSFDGNTKTVEPFDVVDGYYLQTEKLSDLINQIFVFESEHQGGDRDDYLILLLKYIKDVICSDVEAINALQILFKDLEVEGFFEDNISARFFKDKLNSYLEKL